MRRVSVGEYLKFAEVRGSVSVEGREIRLEPIRVSRLNPTPGELTYTGTSVWSFPRRGSWATHRGDYRGNWPPQLVRALLEMYTVPGETVLDPMVGGGTTCIEAKLLGRNCIGVDLSYDAVMLTMHRVYWLEKALEELDVEEVAGVPVEDVRRARIEVYLGDARRLDGVKDETVDFVAMHPPYYNIIRYTRRGGEEGSGDLSRASSLREYLDMLSEAAGEAFRVLKRGGHLGVLLGDTRVRRHYVPITHYGLDVFFAAGFLLREEVVKIQHRMKTTRERWVGRRGRDFLLIYHEKLYVLRKPVRKSEYSRYRYSAGRL